MQEQAQGGPAGYSDVEEGNVFRRSFRESSGNHVVTDMSRSVGLCLSDLRTEGWRVGQRTLGSECSESLWRRCVIKTPLLYKGQLSKAGRSKGDEVGRPG